MGFAHGGAAHAAEVRWQGFDRFGRAIPALQTPRTFPYIVSRGVARGSLNLATVGPITSIAPYDYDNGKLSARPETVDELLYESLMSEDPLGRADRLYPLVAEAVRVPDDFSYVVFEIDKNARFSDGVDVTGSEVYMSYLNYKLSTAELRDYLSRTVANVIPATKEIRFELKVTGQEARDAIMTLARMKILKTNTTGNPTMGGIPVRFTGTGPYTVTQLSSGKITLLKNQFYWGSQIPTRKGFFNFRQVDITSFTNQEGAEKALGGSQLNYFVEDRQTAVKELTDRLTQNVSTLSLRTEPRALVKEAKHSFIFNVSRPALRDIRVRKALMLAYDYDLINQIYFLNQLKRPSSLIDGTGNEPAGPPPSAVQTILSRCELPSWKGDAFENYGNALYRQLPDKRTRLLSVMRLLQEAGYSLSDQRLFRTDNDGKKVPLRLKFLAFSANDINRLVFFKNELVSLGIDAEVLTLVTRAQFEETVLSGDYDLVPSDERLVSLDLIPRVDLAMNLFGSKQSGPEHRSSKGLYHISDPCLDGLIEEMSHYTPASTTYYAYAQALARAQQILYLNIFAGDSMVTNFFTDRRFGIPGALSYSGMASFGYWDNQDKE
jgi:ABC-type oligopeptide transport system substrate-binding subunit